MIDWHYYSDTISRLANIYVAQEAKCRVKRNRDDLIGAAWDCVLARHTAGSRLPNRRRLRGAMQDFLRRWTVVEPTDREEVLATTSLLPQEIDAILDEHNTEEVTRRIVHLRAQGYTAREIAGQVELSKTTVDRRLRDFATNLISTRGTNERRESQ